MAVVLSECLVLVSAVESIQLSQMLDLFRQSDFTGPSDRAMTVTDVIRWLTSLFAELKANDSKFNSVLCVDLTLNWLLNVYDRQIPFNCSDLLVLINELSH